MTDLKIVWPRDGHKGKRYRSFLGGLRDICTDRGPDFFLQKNRSIKAIKPDVWGNWDSYHSFGAHVAEEGGPFVSRELKRYDPQTRRYVNWFLPEDWNGNIAMKADIPGARPGQNFPRYTQKEWRILRGLERRGQQINPWKMGSDWHDFGPKRFQYEHDWFWRNAHKIGDDRFRWNVHGAPPLPGTNPNFRYHQEYDRDPEDWWWHGL